MNEETMTDALALDRLREAIGAATAGEQMIAEPALEHIATRLRGEAAQGEQQAVAWVSPEQLDALRREHDSVSASPHKWRTGRQTVPLYTRPQPVAGDAVRALPVKWRASIDAASPHRPQDLRPIRFVLDLETALSTQPAPSEQVAARQINREFVEGVKQLCRDYSCRQNRPYMGDVFAQLDYLAEQLDMTVAPPEQVTASVPCAFRSLLAEARRQYRDSDAAGDVLAWLDERALDTDYAAPAPVAGELTEEQKASRDAMLTGTGFMLDGKRIAPEDVVVVTEPVAGDAVAKLVKAARKVEKAIQTGGHFEVAEARTEMLHRCETVEAALAKYRASPPALYSLDADPDGIRDRAAATITGALILGSRGDQAPPEGHWLEPFWTMAHAEAELRASQGAAAGVDVSEEMVERLVDDIPRQRELARRLIASGPKAARVSCSETHEISEFVHEACDFIESMRAALRTGGGA